MKVKGRKTAEGSQSPHSSNTREEEGKKGWEWRRECVRKRNDEEHVMLWMHAMMPLISWKKGTEEKQHRRNWCVRGNQGHRKHHQHSEHMNPGIFSENMKNLMVLMRKQGYNPPTSSSSSSFSSLLFFLFLFPSPFPLSSSSFSSQSHPFSPPPPPLFPPPSLSSTFESHLRMNEIDEILHQPRTLVITQMKIQKHLLI